MSKIVVMNVCAKHPPFDGRVYDKISKTLIGCGYEVHNSSPNVESQLTEHGIYLHGFSQKKGLLNRLKSLYGLRKIIEQVHPDCMICHEPDALFAAYRYYKKEKKRRNIKLYFDCHEAYEHWFDSLTKIGLLNKLIGKFFMALINGTVKKIDGVTSVNNTMTERFKKYNANSHFLPSVYKTDDIDEYIENYNTELVYMGQFGKSKQIEMFIGAAKILKDKGILCKITIIGGNKSGEVKPGSLEDIVEKEQLQDYFSFKGWMPREEAFIELQKYGVGIMRFDSYTMPGNYAMPNKLFEYMSLGLAILSCRLNVEIKKIINENQCGLLIESETAEALANAMIYIKDNTECILKMKHNSYEATVKKYNWNSYKELLKRLVEG